ncbi:MAG: GntR family transcriptional regulator [Streptosporangiaceae bacterium]
MTTTPATRTEQVYEILRGELLNGGLHPGQKLKMIELTDRFGVSQSVVREALTRLTAHGRPAVGDRDPGRAPPARADAGHPGRRNGQRGLGHSAP